MSYKNNFFKEVDVKKVIREWDDYCNFLTETKGIFRLNKYDKTGNPETKILISEDVAKELIKELNLKMKIGKFNTNYYKKF